MELLRIGVVGCGAIGREHIERITSRLSGGQVVAVSDVFVEGAQKVGGPIGATVYNNSADLVNDPDVDAVICTTPGFAHKETVMQAIEVGKPIFCEKPLTTTAEESMDIIEAEMESGKHLVQVGFMRRYDKSYRQVKKMLDSGEFGAPLYLKCNHWIPRAGDNYDEEMSIYDIAIHEIDVLHWLVGDEYETAQVMIPRQSKHAYRDVKDPQLLFLKCRSGLIAMVEIFMNCQFGYDVNCQIVCEEGVIDLPAASAPVIRRAGMHGVHMETNWTQRFEEAYDVEIQEWINAVREGAPTGPTAWDGFVANITADALVRSQKTGEIVPVESGDMPDFYKR